MTTNYTISKEMQASIEAVIKKFSYGSILEIEYFVENDESERNEHGYFDGADIHHPMDSQNKRIIVNWEGEIMHYNGYWVNAEDLLNE